MIKFVFFDLDGVLIETEKETFDFYKQELAQKGIYLNDSDFRYKAGRKSADFWRDVLTAEQSERIDIKALTDKKRELFNSYPEKYIKKIAGGKELLALLKEKGYKTALTSQNESKMIETVIDWLGLREYFDVIISINDIKSLKPDPEIYLLAAQRSGAEPEEVLVVEDSFDGVNSAKNAGMKCVCLRHEYTSQDTLDRADYAITELSQMLDLL